MARKRSVSETTVSTIDYWTKTVGDKECSFEIVKAIATERGRVNKIFFTNVLKLKGAYSSQHIVTDQQLSRDQVEQLFESDLK
jgi:hypothetical protein